eukprot:CAMPEP_0181035980 /NCGR_PEP_ID=MMETSP1070-20121207/8607_1 /TAXON_ID=265543 /ORGANISM="Minutocellus polymorphus, Strain NH13" /LENGTH=144 /DNA_ID=CAMNT_0023113565 /DNA_START=154 /DNA_END=588 /DNA_ORIENTATION=+
MRPPSATTYYAIPLRSPAGAPPRYVAVVAPMSRANDQQDQRHNSHGVVAKTNAATAAPHVHKAAASLPISDKPNAVLQRRARSVPLQEMREATIAVRDNSRRDRDAADYRDDSRASSRHEEKKTDDDMLLLPADGVHPLKYWEM